jgi:Periplasmic binding protein domain
MDRSIFFPLDRPSEQLPCKLGVPGACEFPAAGRPDQTATLRVMESARSLRTSLTRVAQREQISSKMSFESLPESASSKHHKPSIWSKIVAIREFGSLVALAIMPKGKIATMTGHLAAADHAERVKGLREVVSGSDYQEVPGSPFLCDEDVAKSIKIIRDTLTRYPDLDGFFLSEGWSTFGAPEAYKRARDSRKEAIKNKKFVVVSFDTLPQLMLTNS